MGIRTSGAKVISAVSTWGLKNVMRRPAANMPGKIALLVDPQIIAETSSKITTGSIMVVGTNGKTTVTNLLADAVERSGQTEPRSSRKGGGYLLLHRRRQEDG